MTKRLADAIEDLRQISKTSSSMMHIGLAVEELFAAYDEQQAKAEGEKQKPLLCEICFHKNTIGTKRCAHCGENLKLYGTRI